MRVVVSSTIRALAVGLSLMGAALVTTRAQAQTCSARAPSLNPFGTFQASELTYISYALNSSAFTPRVIAVIHVSRKKE